jgi:hypothetical protein
LAPATGKGIKTQHNMANQMILAEFSGYRAGYFRPKPAYKCGWICPRCGNGGHIGRTTCDVKTITPRDFEQLRQPKIK